MKIASKFMIVTIVTFTSKQRPQAAEDLSQAEEDIENWPSESGSGLVCTKMHVGTILTFDQGMRVTTQSDRRALMRVRKECTVSQLTTHWYRQQHWSVKPQRKSRNFIIETQVVLLHFLSLFINFVCKYLPIDKVGTTLYEFTLLTSCMRTFYCQI